MITQHFTGIMWHQARSREEQEWEGVHLGLGRARPARTWRLHGLHSTQTGEDWGYSRGRGEQSVCTGRVPVHLLVGGRAEADGLGVQRTSKEAECTGGVHRQGRRGVLLEGAIQGDQGLHELEQECECELLGDG